MRSKKAIYNIVTNLLLQLVTIVYGFVVPKIIISNFGSEVNGLISSITQFLAYISLLESGFGPVVKSVLYKPIANKDQITIASILKTSEKFFRRIACIFLVYIVALCFIYPLLVNNSFDWVFTASLVIIIGASTFAEYFFGMTYRLFLQAKQKTYIISLIQIFTYVLSTLAIVILAKTGANIHIIKIAGGIIFVLRPLLQNLYVRKKYHIKFDDHAEKYKLKQKWDGLAQHIAYVIHTNTDITILTIFATLSEISVYSVYYLIISGLKKLIQSFASGIDASFGDMLAKGELKNLNKKFSLYEILYDSISVIAFSCAIVLITPFVSVYTKGVTDADYIRPLFGTLIAISEYIWAIRLPYNALTLAAGHFKQTRIGAWVECFVNIIISVILVSRLGIIGVAIGTIVAMTIRAIEFIYHTNKHILRRSILISIEKILLIILETLLIVIICQFLPYIENTNYLNWGINALMTAGVATVVVLTSNLLLFRKELRSLLKLLRSLHHRNIINKIKD